MKNNSEKTSASVADMQAAIQQLLKDNLVGIVTEEKEGVCFTLPGGKTFLICVKEVA